jgi:hypothetical protein
MIIGTSLGCSHKFIDSKNKNDVITLYRKNLPEINAIEINISEDDCKYFEIDTMNKYWLKNLDYKSLHFLNTFESYGKIFHAIHKNNIITENFICHINNKKNIPSWIYNIYKHKILYENLETEKHNFEYIFNICFDTSHALKFGKKYFEKFVSENENNFKQIHLSNFDKECHTLFHANKKGIENFKFIKSVLDLKKYPIIVESVCNNEDELKRELNFIKENI